MVNIVNNKKNLVKLRQISEKYNLLLLILFGSRAENKQAKNSDYDFAFYTKKRINIDDEMNLFNDLMNLFRSEKIDLINININYDHKLRNEIFQKGFLIYEFKKSLFSKLQFNAWMDYQDFKRFYKSRTDLLKESLKDMVIENG